MSTATHAEEVASGERFEFGENWRRFLASVDESRIATAIESLQQLLDVSDLKGKRVVDVGCGSGLFSLASHRLGAELHSLDFDPASVACCQKLKAKFSHDPKLPWTIEEGSALDEDYLNSLGKFDIVYSWGVLHHTGEMWRAIDQVAKLVDDNGLYSIAIYNDQGTWSERWKSIKKIYNSLPRFLKAPFALLVMLPFDLRMALSALLRLKPMEYIRVWTNYDEDRGMNRWHDILDWVGGYPFEVASPEAILDFLRPKGFELVGLKTRLGSLGCNEFVFKKSS